MWCYDFWISWHSLVPWNPRILRFPWKRLVHSFNSSVLTACAPFFIRFRVFTMHRVGWLYTVDERATHRSEVQCVWILAAFMNIPGTSQVPRTTCTTMITEISDINLKNSLYNIDFLCTALQTCPTSKAVLQYSRVLIYFTVLLSIPVCYCAQV